jgi:hypothetical protein
MTRRKGRVGNSYTKKPRLAEFERPPASDVVVRNFAGEVLRVEQAKDAVRAKPRRRFKRGSKRAPG